MSTIQHEIRALAQAYKLRTGEPPNIIRLGWRSWHQLLTEMDGRIPMVYEGMEFVNPNLQELDELDVVRWDEDYLKVARGFALPSRETN